MLHGVLLVSAAVCALGLVFVLLNLALIPRLARQPPAAAGSPRLSVVIPARNEEQDIEAAVRSHLSQDYPNLEILVVEDRSTDATGRILERLAREDRRLSVLAGVEPPAGWLGKPHALAQGASAAKGEWILFADADVRYDRRAVSEAMAYAQSRGLDFLMLLPRIEMRGFWENVLMPYLLMAVFQAPAFLANRRRPRWIAGGGGAGNLIRRSAYEAIGGHAALKDSVVDDVRLGYSVKAAGFAFGIARAEDGVAVRMYRGFRQVFDGFTKNIAYVYRGATGLVLLAVTIAMVGAAFLPGAVLLAALLGMKIAREDLVLALAGYGIAVLARVVLASNLSDPKWPAVTHPIMAAVWSGMLVRSLYHRFVRRRLMWRGREFEARAARFSREEAMRWMGLVGMAVILAVALLFSKNRRAIRWRTVGSAFGLRLAFAFLVLYWERGKDGLERFSDGVGKAIAYADRGAGFLFGWLAGPMDDFGQKLGMPIGGYIFAFKVLPIIIFICAFFSILYHFGIIQLLVQGMARVMQKTMKVSGAEALCVAANVFIGQTEAPVLIAPYIGRMTTSELLTMMTGGMAHVSGAVMLAYVTMGAPLKYLITASVMAAPGTFLIAKILWPEHEEPVTMGSVRMKVEKTSANFIDAAATGASQGMTLALNISAMLIAFVALVAMLNGFLGWAGGFFGHPNFQLQTVFGWVLGPLALILGAPKQDAAVVGNLIANKTVINEFFAFSMMKDLVGQLSEKGKLIATFALCGFANFSSIGIQIGGIGGLAPTRKSELARLGFRALLGGSLVSFMTAAIAGIIYGS